MNFSMRSTAPSQLATEMETVYPRQFEEVTWAYKHSQEHFLGVTWSYNIARYIYLVLMVMIPLITLHHLKKD